MLWKQKVPLIPLVIPRQLFLLGEINIAEGYGMGVGADRAEAAVVVAESASSLLLRTGVI